MSVPPKQARSVARLAAVQALYQMEVSSVGAEAVIREFAEHRAAFGDVSVIPTPVFFNGLAVGEEVLLEIDRGKTLVLRDATPDDHNAVEYYEPRVPGGAQLFFGVIEGVENHAFDLLIRESVSRLDFNLRLLAAALLARGDLQDAVSVDEELDFDTRQTRGHGRNAL